MEVPSCPRCGGESYAVVGAAWGNSPNHHYVKCEKADCRLESALFLTEAEAVSWWQTRWPVPQPSGDVGERARVFVDHLQDTVNICDFDGSEQEFIAHFMNDLAAFAEQESEPLRDALAGLVAYYGDTSLICGNCSGRGFHAVTPVERSKCGRCQGRGNFNNPELLKRARAVLGQSGETKI